MARLAFPVVYCIRRVSLPASSAWHCTLVSNKRMNYQNCNGLSSKTCNSTFGIYSVATNLLCYYWPLSNASTKLLVSSAIAADATSRAFFVDVTFTAAPVLLFVEWFSYTCLFILVVIVGKYSLLMLACRIRKVSSPLCCLIRHSSIYNWCLIRNNSNSCALAPSYSLASSFTRLSSKAVGFFFLGIFLLYLC